MPRLARGNVRPVGLEGLNAREHCNNNIGGLACSEGTRAHRAFCQCPSNIRVCEMIDARAGKSETPDQDLLGRYAWRARQVRFISLASLLVLIDLFIKISSIIKSGIQTEHNHPGIYTTRTTTQSNHGRRIRSISTHGGELLHARQRREQTTASSSKSRTCALLHTYDIRAFSEAHAQVSGLLRQAFLELQMNAGLIWRHPSFTDHDLMRGRPLAI